MRSKRLSKGTGSSARIFKTLDGDAAVSGNRRAALFDQARHLVFRLGGGAANVDRKLGPAGHGVDHAGFDLHRADGADHSAFLHRGKFPANFSTYSINWAAATRASLRISIGVVPGAIGLACKDDFEATGRRDRGHETDSFRFGLENRPLARYAAPDKLSCSSDRAQVERLRGEIPKLESTSASFVSCASTALVKSLGCTSPATRLLPRVEKPKRLDSSPMKQTTSSGARKATLFHGSCGQASRAPITPTGPSHLPPWITVSRCEPANSAGALGSAPSNLAEDVADGVRHGS